MVTEAQWQRVVTDALSLHGYAWLHVHPLMTRSGGWRTPTSGTMAAGWPDLVAMHPTRGTTLFIELKAQRGVLSASQRHVHDLLRQAGHRVYVWRPNQLAEVLEALR